MESKTVTVEGSINNSSMAIMRQKLVIVGDISVGKTSIVNSLIDMKFKDTYEVSIILNNSPQLLLTFIQKQLGLKEEV